MSVLRALRDVAELLRSEGRVSLRLVRREYDLTDDDLATLVDELTEVRGEAVVEGGVLVARRRDAVDAEPPAHGPSFDPSAESLSPGDTEHRDLTVMFCDLVGSTALSTRLDAEDFGDAIRTYLDTVTAVVQDHGGHVANLMGDGLLVLFGYPTAHDDSARQGIAAALAAVAAMEESDLGFDVRAGLHVGPVVISNVGPGGRTGALALGETVNVAARVESAAAPGGVYITDDLARVVQGWYELEPGGSHQFKGLDRPMAIHRVVRATAARDAAEARASRRSDALAGRAAEVEAIRTSWSSARSGAGRLVALVGEPGIGKSRLVGETRREIGADAHWYQATCSPYATASALQPFVGIPDLDEVMATTPPAHLGAEGARRWTLAALAERIVEGRADRPLVLLVEDLHWADPTSVELLGLVRGRLDDAPVLVLVTSRDELPEALTGEPSRVLRLEALDADASSALIAGLPGADGLSADAVASILERAGGNPLYLEELTHTLAESAESAGHGHTAIIPPSLQTPLLARLDGLGAAKSIAQVASVFGATFRVSSLAETVGPEQGVQLADALELMTAKGLILADPADADRYSFRHALIQDAAYHSMLKRRRRQVHARVLDLWLEHGESALGPPIENMAWHAARGERFAEAVDLYERAGRHAAERSANSEAAQHFRSALALVGELGDDAARRELGLQRRLASALVALVGYTHPDTVATWRRTRELATDLQDATEVTASLLGLAIAAYGAADLASAGDLIDDAIEAAERTGDVAQQVVAQAERSVSSYFGGDFTTSLSAAERAISLYVPADHHRRVVELVGDDSGVAATANGAWALMQLGRLDDAVARGREAIALAESIDHPFSIAQSRLWLMLMLLDLDDIELGEVEDLIGFCDEQGFRLWGGAARVVAAALLGDAELHIAGRELASSTASLAMSPAILGIEAETRRRSGDLAGALLAAEGGISLAQALRLPFYDARLRWQQASLLAVGARPGPAADDEIETLLHESLAIADSQSAHWYALLAAARLADHLAALGRPAEARRVLAPRFARIVGGAHIPGVAAAAATLASLDRQKADRTP